MTVLLIIAGVFLVLSLVFLSRIFRCTRQRRYFRAGGAGLACVASAALMTAAAIVALSYFSYARLTAEQLISTIEFRRVAPNEYQARVMVPGKRDSFFTLKGDEWQIDARLVSWQPPMTVLGLEPIYQLERISGRYSDIDREQSEVRTVHSMSENLPIDVWTVARKFPMFTPGIDAHYGSATYVPMADGARFEVSLSRDALIARPANDIATEAVGRWR